MTTQIGSDSNSQRVFISTTPTVDQCWGTRADEALAREAMRCFHRAHYQPENMTVVIVGGIAQKPALELVSLSSSSRSGVIVVLLRRKWVGKPVLAGIRRQNCICQSRRGC